MCPANRTCHPFPHTDSLFATPLNLSVRQCVRPYADIAESIRRAVLLRGSSGLFHTAVFLVFVMKEYCNIPLKIPVPQSQVPGFLYCHVNTIIRHRDEISYSKFIFRISVLQYFDYSESRSEVPPSVSSASATSEASLESDESSFVNLNFSASASLLLRSSSSLASRSAFFGSQRRQSA